MHSFIMVGCVALGMAEKPYTVELSTNGHKRKEVYDAPTPAHARRDARDDYPNALIYEVDTL